MLHGADLKALAALKEKQAEYNTELQQVTMAKLKAEEAVRGRDSELSDYLLTWSVFLELMMM